MAEKLTLAALNERINDALARGLDMQRQAIESAKSAADSKAAAEASSDAAKEAAATAKLAKAAAAEKAAAPSARIEALEQEVFALRAKALDDLRSHEERMNELSAKVDSLEAVVNALQKKNQPGLVSRLVKAWKNE